MSETHKEKDGSKFWFFNDKLHRVDGPAVEWADGSKQWWIRDEHISSEVEQWITENQLSDYREWTGAQKIMFVLRWG